MAAKILMRKYKEGQELILFLNNKKNSPAEIQMQRRMDGFMNFIAQEHENLVVHDVVLNKEDDEANRRTLEDFFAAHPKAVLGAVFNSRVYQWQDIYRKQDTIWKDWLDMTFCPKTWNT